MSLSGERGDPPVNRFVQQSRFQAKRVIKDWIGFYNSERPHTALDKRSPDDAFFDTERTQKAA